MKTPLRDAVEAYITEGRARFHMPGHKGADDPWDITEVAGCDSLYEASGPIRALEKELAEVYGSGASLLSAGGATLCIQAMLALCGAGKKLVAGRGLHRSALNAMTLLGQEPVWVYPEYAGWFRGPYLAGDIAAALDANGDAAAVYITSPDYFGVMSDVSAIARVCKERGKLLLVDNAHGAHLKFTGWHHPMDCGADFCADSLHKTLPAKTGGAALHLANGALEQEARRAMALFGSTSPAYPILLSCERALQWARECGAASFSRTAQRFDELKALAARRNFPLPPHCDDPAKLTVAYGRCGMDAEAFGAYLRGRGVEPEYVGGGVCVLMGNEWNGPRDYARLEGALAAFDPTGSAAPPPPPPRLEKAMGLREAAFSTNVEIPTREAVGRIAARESSPCPPGIPVVMCGERVDGAMADYLIRRGVHSIHVVDGA